MINNKIKIEITHQITFFLHQTKTLQSEHFHPFHSTVDRMHIIIHGRHSL